MNNKLIKTIRLGKDSHISGLLDIFCSTSIKTTIDGRIKATSELVSLVNDEVNGIVDYLEGQQALLIYQVVGGKDICIDYLTTDRGQKGRRGLIISKSEAFTVPVVVAKNNKLALKSDVIALKEMFIKSNKEAYLDCGAVLPINSELVNA